MTDLTTLEREILAFEAANPHWKYAGAREAEIRRRWELSPTRYSQILNALIDRPEAEAYAPACVHRLQRLRTTRQHQRQSRRTGFAV